MEGLVVLAEPFRAGGVAGGILERSIDPSPIDLCQLFQWQPRGDRFKLLYLGGDGIITTFTLRALAWLTLMVVAVLSIVPSEYRPSLGFHGKFDGAVAFAILGGLLGVVYRRHPITVMWVIAMAACGLELAQLWAPGRHVHLRNAEIKAVAGVTGMFLGMLTIELIRISRRR